MFILFGFSCFAYDGLQQFYLFGQIHTSQTGSQPYSGTSPYGECSLRRAKLGHCKGIVAKIINDFERSTFHFRQTPNCIQVHSVYRVDSLLPYGMCAKLLFNFWFNYISYSLTG